ncbi:MAG: polysaccharide deacetylase family protein [Chloroflexi bacterium]|nr:polysaccharide deacetylase family protein [Chloroflexota bacterium]
MALATHGRYDYSAIVDRQDYSWPEGKRLAIYVAVNVEHFEFGNLLGHTAAGDAPWPDHRNFAWRDYGNRVGMWRILKMLDELGLPAVHNLNSSIYDYCPEVVDAIRARGDEIVAHGRTNSERQGTLSENDEKRLIDEVTETITRHEGSPAKGWMAPWMSASLVTPDLLQEAGYEYSLDWPCDDQPIWLTTRNGRILSVPYPVEINDVPQMLARRHTPEEFAQMIIDQFEEMLEQSVDQALVMPISLHTMVAGQPYRLRQVRRALRHIVEHAGRDRIWFTRAGEIASYCASLPAGVVPGS